MSFAAITNCISLVNMETFWHRNRDIMLLSLISEGIESSCLAHFFSGIKQLIVAVETVLL